MHQVGGSKNWLQFVIVFDPIIFPSLENQGPPFDTMCFWTPQVYCICQIASVTVGKLLWQTDYVTNKCEAISEIVCAARAIPL